MLVETEKGEMLDLSKVTWLGIWTRREGFWKRLWHSVVVHLEGQSLGYSGLEITIPRSLLETLEELEKWKKILASCKGEAKKPELAPLSRISPIRSYEDLSPELTEVTVVIPCHNQREYLPDALRSLRESSLKPKRIIILDDSNEQPLTQEEVEEAELLRVEYRDAHRTRAHGLQQVETQYVLFLDADNMVKRDYLKDAIQRMNSDRGIAFVYPVLYAFGDGRGIWHGLDKAPSEVSGRDLTCRNWCDSGSVYRTEVLRQVNCHSLEMTPGCVAADWRVAREILKAGHWRGVRSEIGLSYRVHERQMSHNPCPNFMVDADLLNEVVTIVIAFSGRWAVWGKIRNWLLRQTYPIKKCRLLIFNSSHKAVSVEELGLKAWRGVGIQIEEVNTGYPGLADEDRRTNVVARKQVEIAVTKIYNQLPSLIPHEYAFILEDDVEPTRFDVIERLMGSMNSDVAAVTGIYQHRYNSSSTSIALGFDPNNLEPMEGPERQLVGGSGFGCLLLRLAVLARHPLAADHPHRVHYDVNFSYEVNKAGWKWVLDRGVFCKHHFGGNQ